MIWVFVICNRNFFSYTEYEYYINTMGRRKSNPAENYFIFDPIKNESACKECGQIMKGNHSSNLERHLSAKHGEAHDTVKKMKIGSGNVKREENINEGSSSVSGSASSSNVKSSQQKKIRHNVDKENC